MTRGAFSGEKLLLARNLRGWTQGELGRRAVASTTMISLLENSKRDPSPDLTQALGEALGFSGSFFFEPVADPIQEEECNFRSRTTTREAVKKRVLAEATLLATLVSYLKERLDIPAFRAPDLSPQGADGIEHAAQRCRAAWGVGLDGPIHSMVRLLESIGVVVFTLDQENEEVDAFSRSGPTRFVVLNTAKQSGCRTRFDAAHELGHLCLHRRDRGLSHEEKEAEAHRFAAALLLPRGPFTVEFHQDFSAPNPESLLGLKQRWGVSVAAMLHRAYELTAISAVVYRRAYKKLSAMGWRKGEPSEPPIEEPSLIRRAIRSLERSDDIRPAQLAERLGWAPATLEVLTGTSIDPSQDSQVIPLRPNEREA